MEGFSVRPLLYNAVARSLFCRFLFEHASHLRGDSLGKSERPEHGVLVNQTLFNEFVHGRLIDRIGQCVQGANRFEHFDEQSQFLLGV